MSKTWEKAQLRILEYFRSGECDLFAKADTNKALGLLQVDRLMLDTNAGTDTFNMLQEFSADEEVQRFKNFDALVNTLAKKEKVVEEKRHEEEEYLLEMLGHPNCPLFDPQNVQARKEVMQPRNVFRFLYILD